MLLPRSDSNLWNIVGSMLGVQAMEVDKNNRSVRDTFYLGKSLIQIYLG